MAIRIVGYALSKEQIQEIHAGADCPSGKLKRHKLIKVEKQRNRFIREHGNPFGCALGRGKS